MARHFLELPMIVWSKRLHNNVSKIFEYFPQKDMFRKDGSRFMIV